MLIKQNLLRSNGHTSAADFVTLRFNQSVLRNILSKTVFVPFVVISMSLEYTAGHQYVIRVMSRYMKKILPSAGSSVEGVYINVKMYGGGVPQGVANNSPTDEVCFSE